MSSRVVDHNLDPTDRSTHQSLESQAVFALDALPLRTHNTFARALLVLSVVAVAVLTLTPASAEGHRPPFWCVSCGERIMSDVVQNLALFMPFGIALGLRGVGLRRAVSLGFLLSTVVELLQFAIPGREPSARDILTNTIGTAIGVWIASALAGDARALRAVR